MKGYFKKNLANIITITRILSTLLMIVFPKLSVAFLITYTYAGISDVIDGFIARKLHIESDFGKKLDSIADLLFYTTMMVKIYGLLLECLPVYVWVIIYGTVFIRACAYIYCAIKYKTFMSNHTYFNKITGLLVFLIPYIVRYKNFVYYAIFASIFSFFATIYDVGSLRKKN